MRHVPRLAFRCRLATIVAVVGFAVPVGAQTVRVGPVAGLSMIERTDTSLTHGPLLDEITLGRTFIAGGALDVQFGSQDHLGVEILVGSYHNDVERSCVTTLFQECTPVPFRRVSRGLLYGMQYLRAFGHSRVRTYAAGGVGVKQYWYDGSFERPHASPAIHAAFGVEAGERHLFRAEGRMLVVQNNPLLLEKTQVEIQARATWLFGAAAR